MNTPIKPRQTSLPRWLNWLPFGAVPNISPEELALTLNHYLIVDVRSPQEYQKSHLPGAISLPLHKLNHTRINHLPSDKPVVCICLSAHRSKPATRRFIKSGFDAKELQGGMLAWWKRQLPIE
ncbi:rhodanese-like domain-containing protein [Amphritea sp. 2_MG-2023]|uniref:rhodanese-like domain-containing protein n=1 Tax=Amphritea TaxID=515417 RepID=UPI001C0728CF|nr:MULTISPECIES: rhodanese-like domain-containing protein [Amphritea]MBU2965094.1 rhodanese-like domain-containing protein [Amphritea atlantica]MDO6418879.1 rhodanese-like domain-containing protein [Amphritea sp. 2_MG-2023]MDX2423632.1 rhodanese-like domain-containing protein [Amphritea sp.]